MKLINIFFLILTLVISTSAQQTATIRGSVSDANGAAVRGAIASLIKNGNVQRTATTDSEGKYTFTNVASGNYFVRVKAVGFNAATQANFEVSANNTNTLDFILKTGNVTAQVTVVAEKRETEISKTPTTVNVITDRQVEQAGLTQFKQIQDYVPNLHLTTTGGRATFSFIAMRGFINPPVSLDPPVAIYVDGIPVNDFFSNTQNALFDVDQIEVVKGPQGSLYGVNAQAGVISVTSRRPTNEMRYSLGANIGTFNTYDGNFAVSTPVVRDKFFASFAGQVGGRGGVIRNVVSDEQYDSQFGFAGRLRLVWQPTANWDVALTASVNKIDDIGGYIYLPTNLDSYNALPLVSGFSVGEFESALNYDGFNRATINQESIQISNFNQYANLTFLAGRRENAQKFAFDADITPAEFFNGTFLGNFKDTYSEIRAQSPGDEPFKWTLGFAFNENYRGYATEIEAFAGNPFFSPGLYRFTDWRQNYKSYGVFGQATYRFLSRRLGLTGGLRYDRANKDFTRYATLLGFAEPFSNEYNDSIWLPKLTIDYRVGESTMLYATAGRGWKAGGFNPIADIIANTPYRRETNWTYETGFKTRFFSDRGFFNAAYFYNDLRDYHEQVYFPGSFTANIGNAERVRSYGGDLEGGFSPANGWMIDGSLGLVSAKYVRYTFNLAQNFNLDGVRIRQIPTSDYSIGTTYRFAKSYFVRGEVNGIGEFTEYILDPFSGARRDFSFGNYAVVNLRGGYEAERWSLIGYVNNLADRSYFTNTDVAFSGFNGYTDPLGVIGPRRVVGLRYLFRFNR